MAVLSPSSARILFAAAAVLASLAAPGAAAGDVDPLGEATGGATTVHAGGRNAFSFPADNLADDERTRFAIGNSFFKRNWVQAPSSTTARDGLGPHFIARSCGGCHVQDGRGAPPEIRPGHNGHKGNKAKKGNKPEQPVALLMRLSVPGAAEPRRGVKPDPVYGDQFNNAAVQGVKAEGSVTLQHRPVRGRFADGTPYTLMQPVYGFADLGYGPMAPGVMVSPRIAPQIVGVGLIEAIADADILHNAAEQAQAPGPVKGVPNRVWDSFAGREMLGRFGWKANVATIAQQTASAFLADIGITSSTQPDEACTAAQADCRAAPSGAWKGKPPEIDDATLADVVFYQATLAPPARRGAQEPQVLRGQRLFAQARCSACHRPSYVTAEGPLPDRTSKALEGQRIWPYTDLLLHDMGPALADGRPDFQASGRQWKTPPLWGIGLVPEVNNHRRLLHDGRANGVLEAVLWHGGEAEAARQKVLKMNQAERAALVRFVESL